MEIGEGLEKRKIGCVDVKLSEMVKVSYNCVVIRKFFWLIVVSVIDVMN